MTSVNVTTTKNTVTVNGETRVVTVKTAGPQGTFTDGNLGDVTVSSNGTAIAINTGAVTSAKILDGTIVNADINSSAAIAGTKIDPSFGDQNIFTNGNLNIQGGLFTLAGSTPAIQFNDNEDNPDYRLVNSNGQFRIRDNTAGENRIIVNTDGHIDITSNLDCLSGLNVSGGDITGTLGSSVIGTTQSAGDNSTKIATTAYTDTAISNLVSSAPSTLDTLKELSDALGSDPNFATTVTNSIATKLPLAGGTLTGDLTISEANPAIFLTDTSGAISNPDYKILVNAGEFSINDETNSATRIKINADGHVDFLTNVDFASGIDVTGNISVVNNNPTITLTDDNNNPDYQIGNINGVLRFQDTTNNATRLQINTDGHIDLNSNVDISGALTITSTLPQINLTDSDNSDWYVANSNGTFRVRNTTNSVDGLMISSSGQVDFAGNVDLQDDAILRLGNSNDLQIFHQSSNGNSIIREQGGGDLSIQTNGSNITLRDNGNSRNMAQFITGGACTFKHGADVRLETTSTGIAVTGRIAQSDTVGGANTFGTNVQINTTFPAISLNDSDSENDFQIINANGLFKIRDFDRAVDVFTIEGRSGESNYGETGIAGNLSVTGDLTVDTDTLFVDSTDNRVGINTTDPQADLHIKSTGDCILMLQGDSGNIQGDEHNNPYIVFVQDGSTQNSVVGMNPFNVAGENNSLVLANSTGSSGGIVFRTGTSAPYTNAVVRMEIKSDGDVDFTGNITLPDNGQLQLGDATGGDSQIYHTGGHAIIKNSTGNLILQDDDNIVLEKINGENMLVAAGDGAVSLYFDGGTYSTPKLATTATGVDVNGTINITRSGGGIPGLKILDSGVSSGAPYIEVIGRRDNQNFSPCFSGKVHLARYRSTAKVINGNVLGVLAFGGNHTDGTLSNILYTASISGVASDDFDSATDMPTDLVFYTGSTGRTTSAANVTTGDERMRIKSDGAVELTESLKLFNSKNLNIGTNNRLVLKYDGVSRVQSDAKPLYLKGLDGSATQAGITMYKGGGSEKMFEAFNDGAVKLYFDNNDKLSTTSYGITVNDGDSGFTGTYNARVAAVVEGSDSAGTVLNIMAASGYSGIFFGQPLSATRGQIHYQHTAVTGVPADSFRFITAGGTETMLMNANSIDLKKPVNVTGDTNITGTLEAKAIRFGDSHVKRISVDYTGEETGGDGSDYLVDNEFQEILTITPSGNFQNYSVIGRIMAASGANVHTIDINVALRSNELPNLQVSGSYISTITGTTEYLTPRFWLKTTSTAALKLVVEINATIFGRVTADLEIITRGEANLNDIVLNEDETSEVTSLPTGYAQTTPTKVYETDDGAFAFDGGLTAGGNIVATGDGTFDDIRIGEWEGNTNFGGVFHKNHTGQEYMMINNGSAGSGHTYISATTNQSVFIRGGGNNQSNVIEVDPTTGINLTAANNVNILDGNIDFGSNADTHPYIRMKTNTGFAARVKYAVWNSQTYGMGMTSGMSYGSIGSQTTDGIEFAMTFQMNDESDRGWIFLDASHTNAQGAMSLTTQGRMTVAHSMRLGYGESDTTESGATHALDVSGSIASTSTITCTSLTETSDIALKENIQPLANVLDKVKQLTGYKYNFKNKDKASMGVIAQDVEKVFPELVHGEEGKKSLQYSGLVGALIEAVKELSAKVAVLESK